MKHIHIIGIGGISLSGFATILVYNGYIVSGSDTTKTNITTKLEGIGIKIYYNHDAKNIDGADLVVYSAAIKKDNPEYMAALRVKIPIISRAELMGSIASNYQKVISVAGSHGKTTTTGMIATIFILAGKNPTVHIGGELPIINGNIWVGDNKYFITEACEYYDSFLSLKSDISIILNIQPDHLDYFKNMSNLQNSFKKFAKNTKQGGLIVVNNEDENCRQILSDNQIISYGIECGNLQARNIREYNQCYAYDLYLDNKHIENIELSVEGKHNIYNSLAAISAALNEKIDINIIKLAIKQYRPSKRRFNKLKIKNGALIIHDYAHHPTEIKASISTARAITAGKLVVVFEPHTFSRTQYLWEEFTKCFAGADYLILTPIYPAREEPIKNITSKRLSKEIANIDTCYADNFKTAYNKLMPYTNNSNDTILILGAGTIVHLAEMFGIK